MIRCSLNSRELVALQAPQTARVVLRSVHAAHKRVPRISFTYKASIGYIMKNHGLRVERKHDTGASETGFMQIRFTHGLEISIFIMAQIIFQFFKRCVNYSNL